MAQSDGLAPDELEAVKVVQRLLAAPEWAPRDVAGAVGVYDADVIRGGQVVASVEVTTIANEPALRTWSDKTLRRHRSTPDLKQGWLVTFSDIERVRLNEAMPKVRAVLRGLEAAGLTTLDTANGLGEAEGTPSRMLADVLNAHRVLDVLLLDGLPAGTVLLSSVVADTISMTALEEAVEGKAAIKAAQLAKAPADAERILFLWIHQSRQDLVSALNRWLAHDFGPPPRTLDLPDEIDTVIVGPAGVDNPTFFRYPSFAPFRPTG